MAEVHRVQTFPTLYCDKGEKKRERVGEACTLCTYSLGGLG